MAASSSSIEELDMATEDDTKSSAFSAHGNAGGAATLSWPEAEEITSTLTGAKKLQALCQDQEYNVPDVYTPFSVGEKPACTVEDNAINVYADAFEAGMRLPLQEFYAEVLRHYGIAPSQLVPNAWSYLAAFVLICADAGVKPSLPVFQRFMVLTHKDELYHFRPYFNNKQPPLFRSRIPVYRPAGWKSKFFFLRLPATTSWPCPVKWGEPSRVAICKPTLMTPEKIAIKKLLDKAAVMGKEGIDGLVDSMAGMFKQVMMAVDELARKEKKLQESKEEITQLKLELQVARDGPAQLREVLRLAKEALEKANTAHSVEVGRLCKELQQAKDELRAVKIDCQHKLISMEHTRYVKGLMDMRQLAMDVYPEVVNSSGLKHPLLPEDSDQLTSAPKVPAEIK
ncbi:hypothetical protein EJB05_13786, partial [Eragrostis curvula]